ncbi:toxin-antitoxin system YwqK family antitoxin [Maribacter sp. 2210JD10-5]|uniref:toxin-antitoxin system YwqK family antitoxin n=1 Tax=Maribacter sp. 2210JD10-5 TaxID=3386272 RepID=UPI0039BD85C9
MSIKIITYMLFAFFIGNGISSDDNKIYQKTYHDNGKLKSEGWLRFNVKTGYWKFYHKNGHLSEQGHYKYNKRESYWYFYDENRVRTKEGHYKNDDKVDWWIFYDKQGRINHKCQLNMGVKNGYCLKYKNEKLTSAEKYSNGKKIKEWTSFSAFKSENSLSDLK